MKMFANLYFSGNIIVERIIIEKFNAFITEKMEKKNG